MRVCARACCASGHVQDKVQAPHHAQAPASSAQPTGTTSSSGHHPGSSEAQQATTAAALSGPDTVPKACDLAIALSVLGSKPGSDRQRYAMLSAARSAWPDDPVGLLGLMLLEDVVLGPGEAVIIPAGCPHAYICGEGGPPADAAVVCVCASFCTSWVWQAAGLWGGRQARCVLMWACQPDTRIQSFDCGLTACPCCCTLCLLWSPCCR